MDAGAIFNMTQYADQMDSIFDIDTTWFEVVLSICGMILGLLMAVLGTRVLRFSTFCLGFAMGAMLLALITAKITEGKDQTAALIAGGVGGLVTGVLALCVAKVGKAVVGGGVAVLVVLLFVQSGLANKIGNNYVIWIALGVLVLLGAFMAFKFQEHLFVIATSFGGAFTFTLGLAQFIPHTNMSLVTFFSDPSSVMCGFTNSTTVAGQSKDSASDDRCLALILTWLGLGFVCMIVQWQMNEKTKNCMCLGDGDGDEDDEDETAHLRPRQPVFRARLVGQRSQREQQQQRPRRGLKKKTKTAATTTSRGRSSGGGSSSSSRGSRGSSRRGGRGSSSGDEREHIAIEMAGSE